MPTPLPNAPKFLQIQFVLLFAALLTLPGCRKEPGADIAAIRQMLSLRSLGLAYLEENMLSEAETAFRRLTELAPDEPLGYANLAVTYLRMGKYDLAEEMVRRALELAPEDPDIRLIQAELFRLRGQPEKAAQLLRTSLQNHPYHLRSLYKLSELATLAGATSAALAEKVDCLNRVVEALPANVAARLQLIEGLLHLGQAIEAADHLEALRRLLPEFPPGAEPYFRRTLALAGSGKAGEALTAFRAVHNLFRTTDLYRRDIIALRGPGEAFVGFPLIHFAGDVAQSLRQRQVRLGVIRFVDATGKAFPEEAFSTPGETAPVSLAVGDFDGDGDEDIYAVYGGASGRRKNRLWRNDGGRFQEIAAAAGLADPGEGRHALFADYDNDGRLDLYVVNKGVNRLYRNLGEGRFEEVAGIAGVGDAGDGMRALFVDLDHEGDLDLLVFNRRNIRVYRNRADGTFRRLPGGTGLEKAPTPVHAAAFGDVDDDGDTDLVFAAGGGLALYTNLRQGRFDNIAAEAGLPEEGAWGALALGDYDNDGDLDLFGGSLSGEGHVLLRNTGKGTFAPDDRSPDLSEALRGFPVGEAHFFDFDNDGYLDLLAVEARPGGIVLLHNDGTGRFRNADSLLPPDMPPVGGAAITDVDNDGDEDIFLRVSGEGVRLLSNEGGNAGRWLRVKLVGLPTESGKNNYFGIGARVEVKAGELYQMRVVSEPVVHFGLGEHAQAEVVRVVWTNGVPQNHFHARSNQTIAEKQVLKGSCAFLYAWNGERFEFVTDILWRSALGMPLGIMGGETAYAFPNSADEYLKLPGEFLKPRNGRYTLQITEELWETSYFDELKLIVVDHPDSVEIFVDERFTPPPYPPLRIYTVGRKRLPLSATDERGADLLSRVEKEDGLYIDNLIPTRYQGITRLHDLILNLGDLSAADSVWLFLKGWIFPTDASINVSVGQSPGVEIIPPYLQVPDENGRWQTVVPHLSFPMGKNKMVIADLTGKFLTRDYRVRIRTNMQIYWDHVFVVTDPPAAPLRLTRLQPGAADLHYRGFSRLYRRGRHGPHWFDYHQVDPRPRWRDLIGFYTRYGDVTPLLLAKDDRYVILNAGDEMTVHFDATGAPALPSGWKRDFLIYSDGWVKDGDLNTAHGKTVAPLPFHGMSRYPYPREEHYPMDAVHRAYLREYNTRWVEPNF